MKAGYRFREDLTSADAGFEAEGATAEELFRNAARALLEVMTEDPETIERRESKEIRLESGSEIDLLHDFLQQFVFWKDVDQLLLFPETIEIRGLGLHAILKGERIDPAKHALGTDVKAVTYHQLRIWKSGGLWKATVVVDI